MRVLCVVVGRGEEERKEKNEDEREEVAFDFFSSCVEGGRGGGGEGGGWVGSVMNGLLYVRTKDKQIGAKVLQNTYSKRHREA